MKKQFLTLVMVALGLVALGQSTLPNGTFENWYWAYHPTHANQGFYEPSGGFFTTLNILDTIPTPPGLMCYPTDSAYSGDSAVRVITKKIDILNILIPGLVGTIKINWAKFNATLGRPYIYTTKPLRFQGYHMAFPVNGDSTAVVLLLSKWSTSAHKRDTIAYNKLVYQGTINTYTLFDTAVNYWDNLTMPDSITVLLLASAGFNAVDMEGCKGQVGSQAYYDDVTLTNINGIPTLLMPDVDVKLYPNPATDFLMVTLSKPVKNGVFEIYDAQGKFLSRQDLGTTTSRIALQGIPSGTYYYKVTNGKTNLNTGMFLVTR